ncbi:MAG: hypothetical protein ACLFN5_03020 [bacterium]
MLKRRRVVTNSDLDAIVSAVLLKRVEPVGAVQFVPHEDIRSGMFKTTREDIVVNMPFLPGCRLWFDHHASNSCPENFEGLYNPEAPSAARVVYNHYSRLGRESDFEGLGALLAETDRVDNAEFTPPDIEDPRGAVLLSFIIDSNPLARHSVGLNQLMISLLAGGQPATVIEHPVFIPKIKKFRKNLNLSKQLLAEKIQKEDGLVILDYRNLDEHESELCNNKFLPFVIYPDAHTLLRIKRLNADKIRINLGFNMFLNEKKCPTHYGHLLARFDGGGHHRAAGCAVKNEDFSDALKTIKNEVT